MERASKFHSGRNAVRSLLDSFDIDGPQDKHRCLVHPPLWEKCESYTQTCAFLPSSNLLIISIGTIILLDIKADNIMFGIADDSVFTDFEEMELEAPLPRREIDGKIICVPRTQDAYRMGSPGLMRLRICYACVDIWNVGCMIWDLFETESLFTGYDPEFQTCRSRAHLSEIISLLGPPPLSLLAQGKSSHKFFHKEGHFCVKTPLQPRIPLEERESKLEGED
ncbi:uncharacterized protein N7511_005421 [Penicillium nucicola]|uniref:uncharacterized protein n=1 Tax=Penicillium nucicola TaxID=1850975 RepID=UPI00254530DA|nr:uncharacterized protein N7511_005421 [Penicillium nucicola]KAJ5762039.1 hypothetical protein N7511_005421 [Penicillium nucicola]